MRRPADWREGGRMSQVVMIRRRQGGGRKGQKGQLEIEETARWSDAGATTEAAGNEWKEPPSAQFRC